MHCFTRFVGAGLASAMMFVPSLLHTQEPLGGGVGWEITPRVEQWTFGEGSVEMVRSAQQFSLPLVMVMPVGRSIMVDAYAAWTSGEITALDGDGVEQRYRLAGVSDVKVRATIRLRGDGLLLTAGMGIPTGRTGLDGDEYAALRVLAAPALRLHAPAVGSGLTATTGIVFTRQISGWAWGAGASYEYRGRFAPIDAAAAGLETLDLDPGDAIRLTLGTDGLVGRSSMSLLASATVVGEDRLRSDLGDASFRFGPAVGLEWRLRTVLPGFREVTFYAWDRYRLPFRDGEGASVPGSSGNEFEAGAHGHIRLGGRMSLVTAIDGRHHTGLRVNEALATAASFSGGATAGLSISRGRLTFQPFIRGQAGQVQSGDARFRITGFAGGLTIGSQM